MTSSRTEQRGVLRKSAKILFWRASCPELTLKRLNHGSGKGFLELTVPNGVYDKINAITDPKPHPGCVMAKKASDAGRTYLLTMVVWNVLLAFYDESEQYGLAKGQREAPEELKRLRNLVGKEVDVKGIANETAPWVALRVWRGLARAYGGSLPSFERPATHAMATRASHQLASARRLRLDGHGYINSQTWTIDSHSSHQLHRAPAINRLNAVSQLVSGAKLSIALFSTVQSSYSPPTEVPDHGLEDGKTSAQNHLRQERLCRRGPPLSQVIRPRGRRRRALSSPHPRPHARASTSAPTQTPQGESADGLDHSPREVFKMFQQLEPTARNAPGFGVAKLKKQLFKEYGIDVDVVEAEMY
ncbi:hypothetical protein C8R44DRAFT_861476 [Mycena epipterygia]|nr:hypothetical protein C8R44DRAFT_861476 [Mycena epipterygia]